MYDRYETASESLVVALDWAMNAPDTVEYGQWDELDIATQEQVIIELVDEIYSYACGELGFPTDFVDDCFEEATKA
jgi:hypothetical protein